jgi:hypothetical protein
VCDFVPPHASNPFDDTFEIKSQCCNISALPRVTVGEQGSREGRLEGAMVMCQKREVQIEDLRNHGLEAVMTLKRVLACGAKVSPDPKRAGFYEVESRSTVYYIYAPRLNGKVTLLATWPRERELVHSGAAA